MKSEEEHIRACSGCPFVILEKAENVAGLMSSMCGVRVGSIGMAAEPDGIGERLTGIPRFTKKEASLTPTLRGEVTVKVEDYAEKESIS